MWLFIEITYLNAWYNRLLLLLETWDPLWDARFWLNIGAHLMFNSCMVSGTDCCLNMCVEYAFMVEDSVLVWTSAMFTLLNKCIVREN